MSGKNFSSFGAFFYHFMDVIRPNLGHFSLYVKYRKIGIFYKTSTHVCVYKSRTVDFCLQHVIYQIEEEELLYAMDLKSNRFEKNAMSPPRALNLMGTRSKQTFQKETVICLLHDLIFRKYLKSKIYLQRSWIFLVIGIYYIFI